MKREKLDLSALSEQEISEQAHELLLSDSHGIYIPKIFVEEFDLSAFDGINPRDVETCKDPDDEWYWEAWNNIEQNATLKADGRSLRQSGNLWLVDYALIQAWEEANEAEFNWDW